ncbi:NifB/NifX family molybdenum-iron cluster-binding protein [Methanolobus sp. ZRKC5]|uniref:NifB/NifX family molybdenum-iron cluster-binding protein n=1 Tax=unclassified Methanolobus TaxID=2629569 RepID=UPI00313C6738
MKVCVTATSASFDAPVDPHFGRCLYFVLVDTDSMEFEILKNKRGFRYSLILDH